MRQCLNCGKDTKNQKFCSCSCAAIVNNKRWHTEESKQKTSNTLLNKFTEEERERIRIRTTLKWQDGEYRDKILQGRIKSGSKGKMVKSLKEYNRKRIETLMATQPMENWSQDVRRKYLLEQTNHSCSICGYNKVSPVNNKPPLEIHHIDGNKKNNVKENLMVVCLNCHFMVDEKYRFRGRSVKQNDNEFEEVAEEAGDSREGLQAVGSEIVHKWQGIHQARQDEEVKYYNRKLSARASKGIRLP